MKATQKSPTDVQVTPADLLRMAALYLRRHGWHQGTYYNPLFPTDFLTPPACAAGAIGIACAGHQVEHFSHLASDALADYLAALGAFVDYLDTTMPVFATDEDGFVIDENTSPYSWNDDPARTAEQVITALHAAADEWDSLHTPGGER
ncbi:hypothetical protein ABZ754_25835 [Micromonospora purpureochromogenes]|uniref:DUF6197 family protein n=1 Tax=Micromonospora purpureochromogenes TaxID=47872 RepID=UPI0033D8D2C0